MAYMYFKTHAFLSHVLKCVKDTHLTAVHNLK